MYNFLKSHFFLSFLTFHNFLKCKYFSTLFKTSFFFPVFSRWFLLLYKFNLQTSLPIHIPQNTSIYNTVSKHKSIILHLEVERGPGFVSICHSPTANHFNFLYITRKSTDIKAIPYTVSHTIQYIEKYSLFRQMLYVAVLGTLEIWNHYNKFYLMWIIVNKNVWKKITHLIGLAQWKGKLFQMCSCWNVLDSYTVHLCSGLEHKSFWT